MIGDNIRDLRKKAGYTQQQLAEILKKKYGLNTERSMISKWEIGFHYPQAHTLKCLADLFGVSMDYINDDDSGNATEVKLFINEKETTPLDSEIVSAFQNLTAAQQEQVLSFIKFLSEGKQ